MATQIALGNRRIESQTDDQAVIVRGRPVNHMLHLILTLITGVWAIVWLVVVLLGGEKREAISVDEFGTISRSSPPKTTESSDVSTLMSDPPPLAEQQHSTFTIDAFLVGFRAIGVATLAGIVAGFLAAGVGSRLAMRVSGFMFSRDHPGGFATTDAGNRVGEITAEGTIFLLIFGTILGIMGAYFYAGIKPWLPGPVMLRGLLFGFLLLILLSVMGLETGNDDFQRFGSVTANVLLFSSLFVLYGLLIAPFEAWFDRVLPDSLESTQRDQNVKTIVAFVVLVGGTAIGLTFLPILVVFTFIGLAGGEDAAERLRFGIVIAAIVILLLDYLFLLPAVKEGGYRATIREHRSLASITGGGALLVLIVGVIATSYAIYAISIA